MSIFPRFKRSVGPSDDYWYNPSNFVYQGGTTATGVKVSEKTALKYLTVMACISLISSDIGRLPLNLYRKRADGGKDLVTDHKLYDLLHNAPNPDTTSFNWREALQGHLLLWGNSFAFIDRDKTGKIKALWQLPDPSQVTVKRRGDQIVYTYKVNGEEVTRTKDQIFHIPGYGFNGLVGMSMINIASEAIGLGVAAEEFGSLYFGEGTHPAGVLEMDTTLGDNKENFTKALKEGYAGLGKSHKIMVLENGLKYKPLTIPLNDAQFLETRNYQKIEICGMYHVPPHKIAVHGQNSNYNNLEQENASYVDSCLMGWIVRWESNISLQLLTEAERRSGLFCEFVVQGLLRGDSAARSEYYNKIFQVGGITPNQIRAKENMNPVDGGDESFVMMNMIPLSQAKDMPLPGDTEPENEPEIEDKSFFKAFFSEKRARKVSEARSIMIRDRISRQYAPLILDAAQAIVNRESKAIKNQVHKQTRANGSMETFLDDFYDKFPEYIDKKMGPVLRSYLLAIIDATNDELQIDGENFDTEIKEYIDIYAKRHISSSKGQMESLIPAGLTELDTRADEWQERRPEKITTDESVRASSYVFQAVVFGAGMSTVLRNRGPKTCPFCRSLEGKVVRKGGAPLVSDGEELEGKGTDQPPMLIRGSKFHTPIHQGCLPGNSNVTAFGITASSERWFDGDLVVIHTAAGNKVSCTPNHPILTCHGWMSANEIEVGYHVRKAIFTDGNIPIVGNNKNMQTSIHDISKSFLDHRKMIAVPVPAATEDFNGDLANSKITIIRTDGSLLLERDPGLFNELRELNLKIRNTGQLSLTSSGAFTEFIKTWLPSKCSGMSGRDLLLSLGGGHSIPVNLSSLTLASVDDLMGKEVFVDHSSGYSESVGYGVNGLPIDVMLDKVIRIENNIFHGLVYNLHTKDNLFYAENIVVHNCDCYMSII